MIDLNQVQKPVRYIGNESNAILEKTTAEVRVAFCFPDVYEVAMSYTGLHLLYGLLNEKPWIWCERCFAPWPDYEKVLKEEKTYLTSLESHTPLQDFPLVAFSLQHEMLNTNVLTMLDCGGIPLHAQDRADTDPIVIAGGPCALNPAPMQDFIDAFVMGEGEEVFIEICEAMRSLQQKNASRKTILRELSHISGVYVPSLYHITTNRHKEEIPDQPKFTDVPAIIERRIVSQFKDSFFPVKQIVPNTQIIHHRLSYEIMRGCPGGCRYCHAGFINRPKRERSPQRVMEDVQKGLKETGYGELGLLSLSTADYTCLPNLCYNLIHDFYPQRIALSLPSLRIDKFPAGISDMIRKVRSTGLTFAPEAGSERLRRVINKNITDEDILSQIEEAISHEQDTVKFYFMIGLPTETDEDILGIAELMKKIKSHLKTGRKRKLNINISLSPFVPKPHTPFQWAGQISVEEIQRKIFLIKDQLKPLNIKINWHDPRKSQLEAAFARGDARLNKVIRTAWEKGARFDEWVELFDYQIWKSAFDEHGLSLEDYAAKSYEQTDHLPWKAISILVAPEYLWNEYQKAHSESPTKHCGHESCRVCHVCNDQSLRTDNVPETQREFSLFSSSLPLKDNVLSKIQYIYRMRFHKTGLIRYASHRDMMLIMESLFRRAGIEIAFTEGFHPHPKMVFASALSTGVESVGEYIEIGTTKEYSSAEMKAMLNQKTPVGLYFDGIILMPFESKKLTGIVKAFQFALILDEIVASEAIRRQIEVIFEPGEIRSELNLLDLSMKIVNEKYLVLVYTCTLNDGKFTKHDVILEKIRKTLNIPLGIKRVFRLDMFRQNEENIWAPVIAPQKRVEIEELCNVKSL